MEILLLVVVFFSFWKIRGSLVSIGQYESSLLHNEDLMRKKACHRLIRIHYIWL